ncbi:methyl-accepting chemotaxis protein [Halalkalibacter wakoensis JCM 9140]|uniref:Methyl-accepting chemotaxis protein n=1 Tax=Halalkalibacter wakoensis JCM 9140 TaxID=1236970 RepID=W4PY45_9BACI|nr:methyl-accepting chemotaxis protein [Halalkalibacter wakoensis]GAE24393.1 methyl-accepting chemotaxis protein [Halalkalibacter wakoensis JCM 9140]
MEKTLEKSQNVSLLMTELKQDNEKMQGVMKKIQDISTKSNILALNSGIEAARAGEAGKGFAVVATEIKKFAEESLKASRESETLIKSIQTKANEIIAMRTVDIAFDTIDKIDRNLFERNCDVQAWATFDAIKDCLLHPSPESKKVAQAFMENIYKIYEVYFDLFVVDLSGEIIVAAQNQSQVGRNMNERDWFQETVKHNDVYVTDMYHSSVVGGYTMGYSSPVHNDAGEVIGVLTTRFNWEFIYDIIDRVKIDEKSQLYVINKEGYVIASKDRGGILKKDLSHLKAVNHIMTGKDRRGYTTENNQIYAYCLTEGYNAYKGKGWSVIVSESIV